MFAFLSLADAAAAATACGVALAAWALFLQRGQARTQFEDGVVQQYRELIKPHLVLDVMLENVARNLPDAERQRLHDVYLYLDLCNEQVFLRAIGRVSRATWMVQWSDGIRDNVRDIPAVADTWRLIQETTDDFRELRAFEQNDWDDPRGWEPLWRRPLVRFGLATLRVPWEPTRPDVPPAGQDSTSASSSEA
jgi:hypothetical protein